MIQIRRDTAANWTSANPTLAQGELGVETDTDKIKIGDGSTAWTSLGYLIDTGDYLDTGDIGSTVQAYDANLPTWPSTVSATEVGYLDGVTSAIQTQINTKASTGKAIAMAIVFGG